MNNPMKWHEVLMSRIRYGATMKKAIRLSLALVACWVFTETSFAQLDADASDLRKGVIIIASKKGEVSFSFGGKALPAAKVEVDDSLAEGSSVTTGANGSTVLLFSNGTVATIGPDSGLRLRRFTQEKFDADDRKMSDLKEEPSSSIVELDFDQGDLVVGTKKLKRSSSLNIFTPAGTAGIRGTQFSMSSSPDAGVSLDVTESTVAFTPKGADAPVPVTANQGLDVSPAGVVAQRPVKPAAVQTIEASNTEANAITAEVPLEEVSVKMEQATATAPPDEPKEEPKEQEPKEEPTEPTPEAETSEQNLSTSISNLNTENNPNAQKAEKWPAKAGLNDEQKAVFLAYSETLQKQIIDVYESAELELDAILNLLSKELSEELATTLLSDSNVESIHAGKAQSAEEPPPAVEPPPMDSIETRKLDLLEASLLSGNDSLFSRLSEMSEGELTDDWLNDGEVGNRMLTDYDLESALDPKMLFEEKELSNPFYAEAKAVFDATSSDAGLSETGFSLYAGRKVTLSSGTYPLPESTSSSLYLTASESLGMEGAIDFGSTADGKTRVVLMTGGTFDTKMNGTEAVSFSTAVSDLVIAARGTISLKDVSLATGTNLYLESLSDLILDGGALSSSELISLRASRSISVDSTRFADSLKDIRMRADTIDLRNVDFPGSANILLQSLRGPIDGRYPTFGTGKWQYGRVNFLDLVKQGGKSLMTRPLFDANARNLTIGKIPGR